MTSNTPWYFLDFAPVKFYQIPFSGFREKSRKFLRMAALVSDRPENTKLVEDVKFLLSVTVRYIPLNGLRGEVENVEAVTAILVF